MSKTELFDFLNEKHDRYNRPEFIENDPICVPHRFNKKEDIEIAAFLTATIAWGQRATIIKNATKLLSMIDNAPYDFIMNAKNSDFMQCSNFKHRTFNGEDCVFFLKSLQNMYKKHGGIEKTFARKSSVKDAIISFREKFFELPHPIRTQKHVSNPAKGSSTKRLNMFLRWLVRNDNRGVDFGIWKAVNSTELLCPLDVHTANVSRKLGLLKRKQNDWKAVEELTENLRQFDKKDPVKYDFALFGLGIFEKF
ncbi:MAG: TIGR02757 family protein [Flavobacteriales bacterium]|nr:MAG: TIGR02757 family protein [Flavobacteriales bacterium]